MSLKTFRIVDLRQNEPIELEAEAVSAEAAGSSALGISVVRSGSTKDLVGRAYWSLPDQPTNMVRLYRRIGPIAEA